MNYYFLAFKKYATFTGRATRSEFWYFFLFHLIVLIILSIIDLAIASKALYNLYALIAFLPGLAIGVRRVHDLDKNGWYSIIPIYNLVLFCTEGTNGPNEYGPDPLGGEGFGADDYVKPFDAIT